MESQSQEKAGSVERRPRDRATIAVDLRERRAAAAALQAAQQRLELVLDASQIGFWEWDAESNRILFSDQWRRQLGYAEHEVSAHAETWLSRIHPDDLSPLLASVEEFRHSTQEMHQVDLRLRHANGQWRWIHARGRVLRDEQGVPWKFVGLYLDDTARKRAEFALSHQKSILERIAKRESRSVVLEAIVDYVESQIPDSIGSILLLKKDHLIFGAGDRVPSAYVSAVDGAQIGLNLGSFGAAAYRGQSVVVEDIATDPLESEYRDLALAHALRCCWSVPIFSGKVAGAPGTFGRVIGTFSIYGSTPRKPTTEDLEIVNNAVYLAGIAIERASTEEALRDSESRLAAVIANSPGVAIQWYDAQGRVMLWNRASEELFGLGEAEVLGKSLEELNGVPEDPLRFRQGCEQITRTDQPIGPREFDFRRRDGSIGSALSTQFAIPGPQGEKWYACMDVEITERKRSEETLRQSREMLQLILDNIPQGVLWKDRQSRYVGINATVRRAMGIGALDINSKTDLDFDTFTREQAEFFMAKDREVMESDRPQYQILEPMNIAEGGRTIWLNTNKIPLHDADGKVNGVLVTWEDFTEKRKSQELLQRNMTLLRKTQSMAKMSGWSYDIATGKFSNTDELQRIFPRSAREYSADQFIELVHPDDRQRVNEIWRRGLAGEPIESEHRMYVGDDLRWIAIWAEPERNEAGELISILGVAQDVTDRKHLEAQLLQSQKYEGLGVLAGGIAHEFNNILTSVLGNAELGLMNLPLHSPAAPIFSEIGKAARRAAALTKQMLAYSGRGQMEVAPVRLDAIVQEAAPFLLSLTASKAELEFRLQPAPASGDAIQLRQIAIQLASNALEALEGLTGRIVIQTGQVALSESDLSADYAQPPRSAGPYAFLEITDTGCGMTSEVASKIFDPFFSTKFAGRGLGLAAALGIVKRHRGGVQFKTAPGKGTTIRVLLPQSAEMQVNVDTPAQPNRESRGSMILLIEDEPSVRDFLSQLLTGAGYEVVAARDGVEGVERANCLQSKINVVLLDIVMPNLDGWAAFDELRRILPSAPIVIMSGYDDPGDTTHASQTAQAAAFLHKPFRPAQLFAAIKKALTTSS
jgi:two-component system, cell cycle sensor histidine kinase and response regulator CckA